ncbi:hypothetical protein BDV12DRAFT_196233 [Aspergillus spectabilis]
MPTDDIMKSKTNGIDDFPAHWKATLLGEDFWKDAEDWNRDTNARIEADHDQSLHTRFPFNIGPEQTPPRAPSIITTATDSADVAEAVVTEKRSRRFSMSDALNSNSFTGRSSLFPPNRVLELGRRSRSRSNSRVRSCSMTSDIRRSNSLIRSTLNRMSGRRKIMDEPEDEESELELSTREPSPIIIPFTPDQATPANPLMEFRGGTLWAALPRDRRTLGLDVFWPVPAENEEKERKHNQTNKPNHSAVEEENEEGEEEEELTVFPLEEMAPICTFRNLRVLKLTGMMQSYQMYIFMAAWLNTNLEELEIGMALPPRLRRCYKWPYIKGGWRLDKATYGEPIYYSNTHTRTTTPQTNDFFPKSSGTGEGALLRTVGAGEYLDKMCLEKAKIRAMAIGSTRNRLSIRILILTGVVVDADPFLHWFDPDRLKCINFKDNCVDAGFWLSHCMRKVSVLFPKVIDKDAIVGRRADLKSGGLKVIRVEGGKKVGEILYRGKGSLEEEIPRNIVIRERRTKGENENGKKDGKNNKGEKGNEEEVVCESQIGIAI